MLTFLRKIRKSLIESGSARKYLLYAIGEILLVMVGILLALQVNNWNQKRNARENEKVLLSEVYNAIRNDSIVIENVLKFTDKTFVVFEDLFYIYQGQLEEGNLDNVDLLRRSIVQRPVTDRNYPNLAAEVLDSKVKARVLNYYQELVKWRQVVGNYNDFIEQQMRPFLGKKQLLNYGFHHTTNSDLKDGRINKKRLLNLLDNPDVQQIIFEATQKTFHPDIVRELRVDQDSLKIEIQRVLQK